MSKSSPRVLELSDYEHLRKESAPPQDMQTISPYPAINFEDRSGQIQDRRRFEGEREIFANKELGLDPAKANALETLKVLRDKAIHFGTPATVVMLSNHSRVCIKGNETDAQLGNLLKSNIEQKNTTMARRLGDHLLSLVK